VGLHDEVIDHLTAAGADPATVSLVVAALSGSVEDHLDGRATGPAPAPEQAAAVPSVYLQDLTVAGFRGIGAEATLSVTPGPGLTVVVGRNGSGKSSFSDALEVLLTGDSFRWKDKTREWKDGWRNLHEPTAARVTARFQCEGVAGPTTVKAAWAPEAADVADAATTAQHHGRKRTDLADLGWVEPLRLYRPLLTYAELGLIAANPATLYDALAGVLGLEDLTHAAKALADARLARERVDKEAKARLKDRLLPDLQGLADERAAAAVAALSGKAWDLAAVARLAATAGADTRRLEALARLEAPSAGRVEEAAAAMEEAVAEVERLAGTDTHRARRLIELLSAALDHHHHEGDGPCPVCGRGALDGAWREAAAAQVTELSAAARRYDEALAAQGRAIAAARALTRMPDPAEAEGVDTAPLRSAWEAWGRLPEEPGRVAAHLRGGHAGVLAGTAAVVAAAGARYSEREARWSPVAAGLMAWLDAARAAVEARPQVEALKRAESALKDVTAHLRSARFAPIEAQALELWRTLRLQSNVDLQSIELTGGARGVRRVDLRVSVDGEETGALGVVSQGEINCLALSLFFPRATLPDSPFRFLVIDDPVQAMDPARVDGLARVFARMAGDRQVIVFTHDDRLPESLRRLGLAHTLKEVTRRPGSAVSVRDTLDPVLQYFRDAWAVARDDQLPDVVAARIVPGLCRLGVEAALVERVRRERIGRGEAHAEVEAAIEAATTLTQLASLALFGGPDQGGKVLPHLDRWGRPLADAFRSVNEGAHRGYGGSLTDLVNDARDLAERIRS
jgi:recombinational DNA repair ATPase RecF